MALKASKSKKVFTTFVRTFHISYKTTYILYKAPILYNHSLLYVCTAEVKDHGHTKAKSLILYGPNSNFQSQINSWYLDIEAYFFEKVMVD